MAKDERLYGRFTLDFPDSPKIMPLSDAAFRCLVEATLYSRRMLTDGLLSKRYALARWSPGVLQELLENDPQNPSLIEVEDGYLIHDFGAHQTLKADLEARRERRSAAGRKGGLAKAKAIAKQPLKQTASKTYPETETETKSNKEIRTPDGTAGADVMLPLPSGATVKVSPLAEDNEGFDRFWSAYPKKAGKGQARPAFAKALSKASLGEIVAGAEAYRDMPGRDDKYTKNASTWLNGECWADEIPAARPKTNHLWQAD